MPNRRRNNQRRGRGRGRKNGLQASGSYEEVITFSVEAGNTISVTVATLANRPPRSNFRPRSMRVEFASFVPGTTSLPATYTPVGFQIEFTPGSSGSVPAAGSVSNIRLASTTPRVVSIRYPLPSDWYSWDSDPTTLVAQLTAICIGIPGAAGSASYVRGVVTFRIDIQNEISASTCPTYLESHGP